MICINTLLLMCCVGGLCMRKKTLITGLCCRLKMRRKLKAFPIYWKLKFWQIPYVFLMSCQFLYSYEQNSKKDQIIKRNQDPLRDAISPADCNLFIALYEKVTKMSCFSASKSLDFWRREYVISSTRTKNPEKIE